MTRRTWITRIALAALLGAATTVAVAWFIECWRSSATSNFAASVRDPATDLWLVATEERGLGWRARSVLPRPAPPPGITPVESLDWMPRGMSKGSVWLELRTGWPVLAMREGAARPTSDAMNPPTLPYFSFTFRRADYVLSLSPAWPGLLADTAIYAVPWLGAIAALAELRRRRRIGKCPKCLYPLGGLPPGSPCPECGTAPGPAL